jgi:hypothetical protein
VLKRPLTFGGREYPIEIGLRIPLLAARGAGVELAPLVNLLESFPNGKGWHTHLRRALVPLTHRDANVIATLLDRIAQAYDESASSYRL